MKTKRSYKLAASLICGNMLNIREELNELRLGDIDYIHFDVMDGIFVPRYGLLPEMLSEVRKNTNLPIDVHLMVANPEPYIQDFANAGATVIVVHYESTPHVHRLVKLIQKAGVKAGVALNPGTPINVLEYLLDDIDLVVVMAINPGIVGHKLIPQILPKIKELKKMLKKHTNILIEVDGGVTPETAPHMLRHGADMLVCGTGTIYKPPTLLSQKIRELRGLLDERK